MATKQLSPSVCKLMKRCSKKHYTTLTLPRVLTTSSPSPKLSGTQNTSTRRNTYKLSSISSMSNFGLSLTSSTALTQCQGHSRRLFSTSSRSFRELFLADKSIQSPLPDIHLPDDVPFHEAIFEKCDQFRHLPALTDYLTGRSYTYAQVKENTIKVASALAKRGYKKGDVILVFSPNQIDFTILMLASSCLGLWCSAANPGFKPEDLAIQLNNSDSIAVFSHQVLAPISDLALDMKAYFPHKVKDKFVFGQYEGYEPFQTLLEDDGKSLPSVSIDPKSDVFCLPYSSGTTGLPKGVMLSHYNILANTLQVGQSYKYGIGANVMGILPLYHIYGMVVIQFGALFNGAHLHLLPKFEPESFLACMQDKKIHTTNLVPPLLLFMAKHPLIDKYDLSTLEGVVCAAAPLGKEITDSFIARFNNKVTVQQGFGMTELSPVSHVDLDQIPGSVGPLICNTQAKMVDLETGHALGPNQEGEMCVRGPQVMLGYYKNDAATHQMVTEDGWLHTGDIGYVTEDGVFFISDRLKELIKYKGSQVAPAELEALLIGHPDISDACVVGVPDERAGELPKAFVVRKPGASLTEEQVSMFVQDNVADIKRLRGGVKFIEEIPKNPSGKILRRLLRDS